MSRRLSIPISWTFALWFAAFTVCSGPVQASKKKDLQKHAKAAEQAKDFEQAETLYCQLRDEEPRDKGIQEKCEQYHRLNAEAQSKDEVHVRDGKLAVSEGRFDDAIRQFNAITSKRYRPLAEQWLNQYIPAAQRQTQNEKERKERERREAQARTADEERRFQQGAEAYKRNDFDGAKAAFANIMGARHRDAQKLLRNIDDYEKDFDEGFKLAKNKKYQRALERYKAALSIKEDGPWDIKAKIAMLQEKMQAEAVAQSSLRPAPSDQRAQPFKDVGDEKLVNAILSYYRGAYQQAESDLSGYEGAGSKKALALFYLGAARLTRFYLAGEPKDQNELYNSAIASFRDAKLSSPNFRPPQQYISPKILKIFDQELR